jgi:hypothetical protein
VISPAQGPRLGFARLAIRCGIVVLPIRKKLTRGSAGLQKRNNAGVILAVVYRFALALDRNDGDLRR